MKSTNYPCIPGETIAAIATPPGAGGIAIIRITGDDAIEIAQKVFTGPVKTYSSHTAHLGHIIDRQGKQIDRALLLVMRNPNSYTGEDIVELQCHGGVFIPQKVLQAVLDAGARAALPGEFTFKAFLNKKLDLLQAEAVQKLIAAKSEKAYSLANAHLEGHLSKKIENFQKKLIEIAAILEAWVDFPEEDIEFTTTEKLLANLQNVVDEMQKLAETFQDGKRLDHGISLCIIGPPNVGKSSLMNALLKKERAIVTEIAGTTRDLLHDEFHLGEFHFVLTDTAGIRNTENVIEKEGVFRSKKILESSDCILLVFDITKPFTEEEENLIKLCPEKKTLFVLNKADLLKKAVTAFPKKKWISISAKEGDGLELLSEKIKSFVRPQENFKEEVLIVSLRHKQALTDAIEKCQKTIFGLKEKISPEFLTFDLRASLKDLGKMIGSDITEEILSSIFSRFCIGK